MSLRAPAGQGASPPCRSSRWALPWSAMTEQSAPNPLVEALREGAKQALPPVEGEIRAPGLHGPVEVIRDHWGVPHIYANDLHGLFFAQSWVIVSERLFQFDFLSRLATGRLSEMFSELTLP